MKKISIYIFLLPCLLIICNIATAKSNISKSEFYSKIEKNGNTGFVLRYHGGKGKPECFVEGKEYPEGLLTLPVACY